MIKAIIFDFDGVIFNTEDAVFKLIKKLCKKYKCDVRDKKDFLGLYNQNFYKSIAKRGVKGKKLDKFKKECEDELKNIHMRIFQQIPPILKELSRHFYLAVISNNFKKVISENLIKKDLLGSFSAVVGADVIENKIDRINKCVHIFGIKPSETLYVGDTTGDIKEAKQCKVKSMAVTWGFHGRAALKKQNPNYIVSKPNQILKELGVKPVKKKR
ncbi:HAD family hydrolase [Candidatus Woesearchaeota archaeon]|nr:HAD family hydrolase [Candidatus Woesearchaeota archaeon]